MTDKQSISNNTDRLSKAQKAHYAAAEFYHRRHFTIGIAAIVFATLASSLTFFNNATTIVFLNYAAPFLGILAAVFAAIQTFARYLESYEAHRIAAARYGSLLRRCSHESNGKLSDTLLEEWNRVAESSPVTPSRFRN